MSKNVLVTGCAVNIGRSIAEKFMSNGYTLIGTYCEDTRKQALEFQDRNPLATIFECDFRDDTSFSNLISTLKKYEFDVIVNNAGIITLTAEGNIQNEFFDFEISTFKDVFNCNFFAPLRLCLELKENFRKGGSIINIASGGGMRAAYGSISYSASKAALINLTTSLSNSFYPFKQIRVNSISPGWVNPDEQSGMHVEKGTPGSKAAKLVAMGRNASTHEIADVAYYLTTPEASFINGTNIVVDGGWMNHNVIYYEEATGKNILNI